MCSLKDAGVALRKKTTNPPPSGSTRDPDLMLTPGWEGLGGCFQGRQRSTGALKHVRNCRYLWFDDLLPGAPCFLALVDQDREKKQLSPGFTLH